MFQRVIDKIHRMRMERLRARERKKQKAAEKKLSKLKAMKILTQKRLDNLRKKNGGGGAESLGATQLMQVCIVQSTCISKHLCLFFLLISFLYSLSSRQVSRLLHRFWSWALRIDRTCWLGLTSRGTLRFWPRQTKRLLKSWGTRGWQKRPPSRYDH